MFPTSDVDECQTTQSLCEHKCINTNGTYVCGCLSGSSLNSDGKTCTGNVFIMIKSIIYNRRISAILMEIRRNNS